MDREALTAMLDETPPAEEELAMEKDQWSALFPDPFPEWKLAIHAIES